jgi:methyl-accepting chemotaxis protein-1 (serine sensor receptor)
VVAGEVRVLAHRSSAAAREIKELIGNSVENVEAGAHVVRSAGETMSRVVGNADRVRTLLNTVAAGTQLQQRRVSQVSGAVQEVDNSAQRNASLSEEAAAATGELTAQTAELLARVSRFRLPDSMG